MSLQIKPPLFGFSAVNNQTLHPLPTQACPRGIAIGIHTPYYHPEAPKWSGEGAGRPQT